MNEVYRQGDVLVRRIAKPKNPERLVAQAPDLKKGVVLAYGEVTGHAHAIKGKGATLFSDPKLNKMFLEVTEPVVLEHDEHNPHALDPAWYEVLRQREYHPELKSRQVAD